MTELGAFPSFDDDRGTLVPVELLAAGIDVQRVFTVVAPERGSRRGDHPLACREVIVLVTGRTTIEVGPHRDGPFQRYELTTPGQYLAAGPGGWVHYTLNDGRSVVMVLADAPYDAPAGSP